MLLEDRDICIRIEGRSALDIFDDREFAEFRVCLDAEMKRLRNSGLGSKTKRAQPISVEEEDTLWQKGLLGKGNSQALLELRSGKTIAI